MTSGRQDYIFWVSLTAFFLLIISLKYNDTNLVFHCESWNFLLIYSSAFPSPPLSTLQCTSSTCLLVVLLLT